MPKKGIPDRWEMYSPIGTKISRTSFISFKVPLNETLCSKLSDTKRFTPSILANSITNLGLVIDLTNTTRYYNPGEFTSRGIKYEKIFCEGQKIPDLKVMERFTEVVNNFTRWANEGLLIGVHCTHGLNRAGYVVCRYMIESLGFSPVEAISEFEKARGHKLERSEYIEDLMNRNKLISPNRSRSDVIVNRKSRWNTENLTELFNVPNREFKSYYEPYSSRDLNTSSRPVTWYSHDQLYSRRLSPEFSRNQGRKMLHHEHRERERRRDVDNQIYNGPTNRYFNGRSYTAPGRFDRYRPWYQD